MNLQAAVMFVAGHNSRIHRNMTHAVVAVNILSDTLIAY